jgi:hypothetical protein
VCLSVLYLDGDGAVDGEGCHMEYLLYSIHSTYIIYGYYIYLYMVYLDGDGAVDGEGCEGGQRRDEDRRATHRAHQQRVADLLTSTYRQKEGEKERGVSAELHIHTQNQRDATDSEKGRCQQRIDATREHTFGSKRYMPSTLVPRRPACSLSHSSSPYPFLHISLYTHICCIYSVLLPAAAIGGRRRRSCRPRAAST